MSTIYRSIKTIWRSVAPESASQLFFGGQSFFSKTILSLKKRLERSAQHDDIYDAAYYKKCENEMNLSAIGIVDTVNALLVPTSVIDVGCGSGQLIKRFVDVGVPAKGMDVSDAALNICRAKCLEVAKCDLETNAGVPPDWNADLVISTEVAEHLPASCADGFVHLLCGMSKRFIVITAAPPGQGGTDHVNEQPFSYWIERFERYGATFLEDYTQHLRRNWQASGVERSRSNNVLVFRID